MRIDAKGRDGNAFAIMGIVAKLLKATGRHDEIALVQARMMSGNYANLCDVAEEVSGGSIQIVNRGEDE